MLSKSIDAYLALRRAVGFDLKTVEWRLRSFARAASARGDRYVRTETAIAWATRAASPPAREKRIRAVARFARHVRAEDRRHEIPPVDVFGCHKLARRIPPHIYSPEELGRILRAASRLGPEGSLRPHVMKTLIGLLGATGLRISEALALRTDDAASDVLAIRKTKFRKDRLVPLHPTAAAALQRYVARRRRVPSAHDVLFISSRGTPLNQDTAQEIFRRILRGLGLRPGKGKPGPRLHDLRHTFAVRALEASPDGGDPLGRHVHALSTYLGHTSLANTYWYFQATPRLMRSIADSCEAVLEGGAR